MMDDASKEPPRRLLEPPLPYYVSRSSSQMLPSTGAEPVWAAGLLDEWAKCWDGQAFLFLLSFPNGYFVPAVHRISTPVICCRSKSLGLKPPKGRKKEKREKKITTCPKLTGFPQLPTSSPARALLPKRQKAEAKSSNRAPEILTVDPEYIILFIVYIGHYRLDVRDGPWQHFGSGYEMTRCHSTRKTCSCYKRDRDGDGDRERAARRSIQIACPSDKSICL
ncbi:hypothetical protein F4814DRAFT_21466 [Daldinia grandis]|nr:hypothetical protein F4814DRAFT_21466 [Daldinia grandis]